MEIFKKSKVLMMISIAIVAALSLVGCSFGKKKINLNKYITITADGYENVGNAYFEFDLNKFEEDYAGKIKMPENYHGSGYGFWEYDEKQSIEAMLLDDCVKDVYFDKNTNLKNGDEITLSMDINNTIATEYYNVELEFTDMKYTVEGLKEPSEFNPFDYISVSFDGTSPNGKVTIEPNYDIPEMQYLFIVLDGKDSFTESGLKNGDSVTVSVSHMMDESWFAQQYGEILSQTDKSYTVEGLPEYLDDVSLIPQDLYNQMNQQLLDYFNSYCATNWEDHESASLELLGTYLLNAKPGKNLDYNNRLYFVYKVEYSNKDISDFTYYWYGEFMNITIDSDGKVDVDLNDYKYGWAKSGLFNTDGDYLKVEGTSCFVAGFATIEDFEKTYIISKLEDYTYTQNVK